MANYLCRATNPRIPDYMVVKVSVPAGEVMHAGQVFPLKELDSTIPNNYQVFTGTAPAAADMGTRMAIVINDGFETLSDGRRPDGQPDYTQYTYAEGDVVTAIIMNPGLVFEISADCIIGTPAKNGYLNPTTNKNDLTYAATPTAGTKSVLKILNATKNFRMGGQFGYNFIPTVVAMVEDGPAASSAG